MTEPLVIVPLDDRSADNLLSKEWLVTNGLGGYASGTIAGINTRRYHGLFVPNLPSPFGRTLLLSIFEESVALTNEHMMLSGVEFSDRHLSIEDATFLKDFRLHWNIPVWTYDLAGQVLEKKVWMPYGFNTVCISYSLLKGDGLQLKLRPYCTCRKHDGHLGYPVEWPFSVCVKDAQFEITAFDGAPTLRLTAQPFHGQFVPERHIYRDVFYRLEHQRGLDCIEDSFSPGYFTFDLKEGSEFKFIASIEEWPSLQHAHTFYESELCRRKDLVKVCCPGPSSDGFAMQLALAADQFIILPKARHEPAARTVIAGYHWFTDWGRDTMISLEGLTLCTGRLIEAKTILSTFARYVRRGLLPNHFPEGQDHPIYNTVDATFWFFHALDRYLARTNDTAFLQDLFPVLSSIIDHHLKGTDFGIHAESDGLITASAPGYQLTWMDAKVDEWVVTPRRGKPVEIQGLWFNAVKLMEEWSKTLHIPGQTYMELARRIYDSFNAKFWFGEGGYLYDCIDGQKGNDNSFRPNQIFSISLKYPVLTKALWKPVVDQVQERLLTPYGLRSLEPKDKDYHTRYEGSRWNRDAAYHQGLVWAWLIGPFLDAWKRAYPDHSKAQSFLQSFNGHLYDAGLGTISEIFDAQAPFVPRGCIAQAWSVAEVLRAHQQFAFKIC